MHRQGPRASSRYRAFGLFFWVLAACSGSGGAPGSDAGASCPSDLPGDGDCAEATPSYTAEVSPILDQRCRICHFTGSPQTATLFENYTQVFAQRSKMLVQIYGCRMPLAGAEPLSADERATLLKWFVCDAPDN